MMEEQIRRIVTSVVGNAHPSPLRYYHVCRWQNGIPCLHPRHTRKAHPVFLTAAGEVLATGLSPRQWKVLTRRIIYICRMTGLTLDGLSPSSASAGVSPPVPPSPQVTDLDCKRLEVVLATTQATQPEAIALLERLQHLLETADVISAEDVAADLVTMNSQVQVWNEHTARQASVALVFPADTYGSNVKGIRLSILSRMGMSLLGRKVGDVIEDTVRIDKVLYQPEAAGDFHL